MTSATNAGVATIIQPPKLTPPRISLLTSAEVVDGDSSRWEAGYAYSPDGCGDSGSGLICDTAKVKLICGPPSIQTFHPFFVYAGDKCSTWSIKDRDFYPRAIRKLLASESWHLEYQLMTDAVGLGNPHIASPTAQVVTAGPTQPDVALMALEDALGDCMRGGRAMIHVRPSTLIALVHNADVRREGNLWLTPMDNIVVPGRGYPGTGPNGEPVTASSVWMYATSMVQVRRGPVFLLPEPLTDDRVTENNPHGIPRQAIQRDTNDVFVYAERIVSAAFDPTCCVLAAESTRGVE